MPQWKALTLSIMFAIAAIAALLASQFAIAGVCAALATAFLLLWSYRRQRDNTIVAKAHKQRQHSLQTSQKTSPPTSTGSNGYLFVPPPLQNK